MRRQTGSVTLWLAGLTLLVFTAGGISVDLWRLATVRRELAIAADAAAVAAASEIDEAPWRTAGRLVVDPQRAETRARLVLDAQPGVDWLLLGPAWFEVADDGTVTVRLRARVRLTLLSVAHPDGVMVEAAARASPRLLR